MSDNDKQQDYTATDLAKAAGVHFTYTARLCRKGKLPCRRLGRYWIISFEDGQKWLEEREARRESKPEKPEN